MKYKIFIIILLIIGGLCMFLHNDKKTTADNTNVEKRAVFISYIEYQAYLKNKSTTLQKLNIIKMMNNIKDNNFNMILLQVRPFSDAIYNSKIFPSSNTICQKEGDNLPFDILDYFIKLAKPNNIEVHAWINPYRIRSDASITSISLKNPAYKWLNTSAIEIDKGVYYNPAKKEVLDLIIDGVEELITNYDIAGIHYDDYFYPSKTIDLKEYKIYQDNDGQLSLTNYRYQNINNLLKETSNIIKKKNKDIVFGISPAGNIQNNQNTEYLDIKYILSETTYLDYVMPQIYFGFLNSNKPYINTVDDWNNLIKNKKTKLYVALAPYKIGSLDKYAGTGINEWVDSNNILARQISYARTKDHYQGFSLFRYDYLFNERKFKNNSKVEFDNMLALFNY